MLLENDINLKHFTTFKIGGLARFFSSIRTIKDIEEIINFIEKNKVRYFILGGGSNVLISDKGIDGLVIKPLFDYLHFFEDGLVIVGTGKSFPELVYESCHSGYGGLEWAGGLPGTLGGALIGNAGCFGKEMKDLVEEVMAVNLETKEVKNFKKKECQFTYRNSFFKQNKNWLIIEAKLRLDPKADKNYLIKVMQEKIEYRKNNHPLEYPNAGSVFQNLNLKEANETLIELAKKNNKIKGDKIPAGFIIELAGLKGYTIGGAKISEKHANFIINFNNAKFQDVIDLINFVKEKVYQKFNVLLKEEIQIIE